MKLQLLAESLGESLTGSLSRSARDLEIRDLSFDSASVETGSLHFCITGRNFDGHDFAAEAVKAGAVAVVVERNLSLDVPQLVVTNTRDAMARLSGVFYDHPSSAMTVTALTGTNGKTTTAYMLYAIYRETGDVAGLSGTIEMRANGDSVPGSRTTPEAPVTQRFLRRLADRGGKWVVIEATSLGLDQRRLDGTQIDLAIFTNLSLDHLDYHDSIESYFAAKSRLFSKEMSRAGLVCIDDEWGQRLARESGVVCSTYGKSKNADFRPEQIELHKAGSRFRATGLGLNLTVTLKVPGPYNVANALAAAAAAHLQGISADLIVRGLSKAEAPGRFQRIDRGQDFGVVVDYAHTPSALREVLRAARALTDGRVLVVFGCGGDRDTDKRPLMGAEAAKGADLAIITSDNPRSEEEMEIIAEIEKGMNQSPPPEGYVIEAKRAEAIRTAISRATTGDIVVIAGKGHETYQEFADKTVPFDDAAVASAALEMIS